MRVALAALLLTLPCNRTAPLASSATPTPTVAATSQSVQNATDAGAAGSPVLAPLAGVWLETVTLDDGSDAKVSLPLGATTPRPLMMGIHGAGDRPEWACGEWRGAIDAYAFIVCPHGTASGNAFVWSSIDQLEKRVLSALSVVRAKYGAYVDAGPAIYAGFSQGATLGGYVVRRHADLFPTVAFDEGGWDSTTGDFGAAFSRAGGKRVLLACSTWNCETRFSPRGVESHVAKLGAFGHTMDGRATTALHEQWKWLVRDDARWKPWLDAASVVLP